MNAKHLKERINRNGIRHDFIYSFLDIGQAQFSQMLNGSKPMKEEHFEMLTEYLDEIEKVNKKYIVV